MTADFRRVSVPPGLHSLISKRAGQLVSALAKIEGVGKKDVLLNAFGTVLQATTAHFGSMTEKDIIQAQVSILALFYAELTPAEKAECRAILDSILDNAQPDPEGPMGVETITRN